MRAELAATLEQLRWIKADHDTLSTTLRMVRSVLSNRALQAMRPTAIALAFEISSRQNKPERDGFWRINLKSIAERAGCAETTAGRHIQRLAETGVIERRLTTADNNRPGEFRRWLMVRPVGPELQDVLAPLANAVVTAAPRHGGRRSCPNGCNAPIKANLTLTCTGCGEIFAVETKTMEPKE